MTTGQIYTPSPKAIRRYEARNAYRRNSETSCMVARDVTSPDGTNDPTSESIVIASSASLSRVWLSICLPPNASSLLLVATRKLSRVRSTLKAEHPCFTGSKIHLDPCVPANQVGALTVALNSWPQFGQYLSVSTTSLLHCGQQGCR